MGNKGNEINDIERSIKYFFCFFFAERKMLINVNQAIVFVASLLTVGILAQGPDRVQNPCTNKQTCGDCIQTKGCSWCFEPDFNTNKSRCFSVS